MRPIRAARTPSMRHVIVRPSPLDHCRGILQFGRLRLQAALGRTGIKSLKREGDGATPRGAMRVLNGYRRGDRGGMLASPLDLIRIKPGMLWCDAPTHAAYNRPVRAPFGASHEQLMRADELYDICVVLDWNITQRKRGKGSAIFLHIARPGYLPTEGCLAVARRDFAVLVRHLRPGRVIRVL